MAKETYIKIFSFFSKSEKRKNFLIYANKVLTYIVYIMYPSLLIYLFLSKDTRFIKCIIIPAFSFIILTVFRKAINAKRPYEVFNIDPIIKRDKKGSSFPSRHVFSVFIIALMHYYIFKPIGIFLFIVGTLLALMRVLGGVHFLKDVFFGALIGILFGYIGLII
ncbi:phosphatase PAP2 family protein [Clostridium sp. BJN0001]|uniref:phosphatase PAP2 family protein n=1 Tax=Clostridium sp. BJN0001 TaxID=2930219 RepID=UPI001FD33690|nr:phosphatase PAP2 family protein [Clostridium sp. BJN0001]